MNRYFFYILIALGLNIYAQNFPDYKERNYLGYSDSLYFKNYSSEAAEGSIDPAEYTLGPGDKLFVSILGLEEVNFNLIINQEGLIYLPKIGSVDLNNTLLVNAKKQISEKVAKYYHNVNIFVALTEARRIRVSILGNVKHPSSYNLRGSAHLIDLIASSQGLNENSNYRSIVITGKNNVSKDYDFLSYLRYGDKKNNPILQEGDIVLVDKVDKTISISGEVKYPGGYEFVEGEKVWDFITLAGGLTSKAQTDSIEVISFDLSGKNQISKYYSIDQIKDGNIILNNLDQVIIREKPNYLIERYVYVQGKVLYPGYYKINEDKTTLKDIITEAGGFDKEASLNDATLYRNIGKAEIDPEYERLKTIPRNDLSDEEYDYLKAKSRQKTGKVIVDFGSLFLKNNLSENVVLKMGDVINVPSKQNYVIMLGQVLKPGNIIYKENYNYQDYINLAGGFGWHAVKGDVRIIKANTGKWIDAEDDTKLEPGDAIWVPEKTPDPKFWSIFTTSLTIVGQTASIIAAVVAIIVASRK